MNQAASTSEGRKPDPLQQAANCYSATVLFEGPKDPAVTQVQKTVKFQSEFSSQVQDDRREIDYAVPATVD